MTSQPSGVFNKQMFPQLIVGASEIIRQTHAGKSLDSLWEYLIERVTETPDDASAIMDYRHIDEPRTDGGRLKTATYGH